ncbi:GNAT family N-acetyltransferase [Oscillospiraceae bacterium WX1]
MVDTIYSKCGLKINTLWFCKDAPSAARKSHGDLVFLHGIDTYDYPGCLFCLQHSLITDLTQPQEALFDRMVHGYKRQIRKAEKDGVMFRVISSRDMAAEPGILEEFKRQFKVFTNLKGVGIRLNDSALKSYQKNGSLVLTMAYRGEDVLAQHLYVTDGASSRCLHSVSNFRLPALDRNTIGMANKFLHWCDLCYFKERGYQSYDWGGVTSVTAPNGVDAFKLGFGGVPKSYYQVVIGKSLLGKIAVYCRKLKREKFYS